MYMFIKQLLLYLFLLHNQGEFGNTVPPPFQNKHVDLQKLSSSLEKHKLLRNLLDTNVSTITKIALIELYMGDKNRVSVPNLTNGLFWD
jgi:hypothetical protein